MDNPTMPPGTDPNLWQRMLQAPLYQAQPGATTAAVRPLTEQEQIAHVQASQQARQAAAAAPQGAGPAPGMPGMPPGIDNFHMLADPRTGQYSPALIQQQMGLQPDSMYGNTVNRMAAGMMPMRQAYDEYIHPEQNAAYAQMAASARSQALQQYLSGIHGIQGHELGLLGAQNAANQTAGNLGMQLLNARAQMSGNYQARDVANARLKAGDTGEAAAQSARESMKIAGMTPLDFSVGGGPGGMYAPGPAQGQQPGQTFDTPRAYDPILSELQGSMPQGPAGPGGVRLPPSNANGQPLNPSEMTSQYISNLRSRYGDAWVKKNLGPISSYIQEKIPDADQYLKQPDRWYWAGGEPNQAELNRKFINDAAEAQGAPIQHTPTLFGMPLGFLRPEFNALQGKFKQVRPSLFKFGNR